MVENSSDNRNKIKSALKESQDLVVFTISTASFFPKNARQVLADRMINLSIDILEEIIKAIDDSTISLNDDRKKRILSLLVSLNALFGVALRLQYITSKVFAEFGHSYSNIKNNIETIC